MSETQFQKKILNFLKSKNIYAIKQNASGLTKTGVPDIISNIRGLFVAIEVKKDKYSKPTELQKYNINEINKSEGIAFVLRPDKFEIFKLLIEDLLLDFDYYDIDKFKKRIIEQIGIE